MGVPTIYCGTFIHTSIFGQLEVLSRKVICVDRNGIIVAIKDIVLVQDCLPHHPWEAWHRCLSSHENNGLVVEESSRSEYGDVSVINWGGILSPDSKQNKHEWWFPGFVDTHSHPCQYPNIGIFGQETLLTWLHRYTFPSEASLASAGKAELVYRHAIDSSLRHGTTTAAYFATTSVPSTTILAKICLERGQRAYIGRCCMDREDTNPEYYRDASADAALEATIDSIADIQSLEEPISKEHKLLTPILTPRFAPSCSSELLQGLGKLAQETNLPIQTHISENDAEIDLVRRLYPAADCYAAVYESYGLLTSRTILAHGVHLSEKDKALIRDRKCSISHCPTSNLALSSGLCPVRELLEGGITIGLGTDVSGGYSSSILTAARDACLVSRVLSMPQLTVRAANSDDVNPRTTESPRMNVKLTVEECLYLATKGGATALGLSHKTGSFCVGLYWDAQLIRVDNIVNTGSSQHKSQDGLAQRDCRESSLECVRDQHPVQVWGTETWNDVLAKWIFCGDDRNTEQVYVQGRLVSKRK